MSFREACHRLTGIPRRVAHFWLIKLDNFLPLPLILPSRSWQVCSFPLGPDSYRWRSCNPFELQKTANLAPPFKAKGGLSSPPLPSAQDRKELKAALHQGQSSLDVAQMKAAKKVLEEEQTKARPFGADLTSGSEKHGPPQKTLAGSALVSLGLGHRLGPNP